MTLLEILSISFSIIGGLLLILMGIIGWIGRGTITQLKSIASSVNRMENDLGILSNDHIHLKEAHTELKSEVKDIKDRVITLEK